MRQRLPLGTPGRSCPAPAGLGRSTSLARAASHEPRTITHRSLSATSVSVASAATIASGRLGSPRVASGKAEGYPWGGSVLPRGGVTGNLNGTLNVAGQRWCRRGGHRGRGPRTSRAGRTVQLPDRSGRLSCRARGVDRSASPSAGGGEAIRTRMTAEACLGSAARASKVAGASTGTGQLTVSRHCVHMPGGGRACHRSRRQRAQPPFHFSCAIVSVVSWVSGTSSSPSSRSRRSAKNLFRVAAS